ncbi:MAG: TVP38/TMEM64 family protein [bacterium]
MQEPRGEQALSWRRIAAGAAVLTVIVTAYLWLWLSGTLGLLGDEPALTEAIRGFGIWGPVAIVALIATAIVVSPVPSAPVAIAAGMIYGAAGGTVIVVIGAELGAVIAFLIARWLGYETVRRWAGADRIMSYLSRERSQFWLMAVVFVSRLLPFISFDAVSYAAGLTPLMFWRFALATVVGITPVSFLLTYAGEELSTANLATISLVLIVLVALPLAAPLVRALVLAVRNRW